VKQYFNEYVSDKTNKPTGRGDLYVMPTLTKALTADVGTNADISILFDVTRRGLGVGHLAIPELNEHSDIGIALKMEECMAISCCVGCPEQHFSVSTTSRVTTACAALLESKDQLTDPQ
jgi:hypothetical protein